MNPYAKIGIKVGVVVVICLILWAAYNIVVHRAYMAGIKSIKVERDKQQTVATQLESLLKYQPILPQIRYAELRDMETIRNLIPPRDEFVLTSYLRVIHSMLSENHLETDGILIGKVNNAVGGTSFEETFASDITALQKELSKITDALQLFQDGMGSMGNLVSTYYFYKAMSTGSENYAAIIGGIESHSFQMKVTGSYEDIKKFSFQVFNMRPHTALVALTLTPAKTGMGPTRLYQATFSLYTYGDANKPPPLWIAYHGRGEKTPPQAAEPAPGSELPAETRMPPAASPDGGSAQPAGEQPATPPAVPGAAQPENAPKGGIEANVGSKPEHGGSGR
jgi:hypothetical protein